MSPGCCDEVLGPQKRPSLGDFRSNIKCFPSKPALKERSVGSDLRHAGTEKQFESVNMASLFVAGVARKGTRHL